MTPSSWTDERLAALEKLYRDNLSVRKIATRLSEQFDDAISPSAVIGKIHRMGWVAGSKVPKNASAGVVEPLRQVKRQTPSRNVVAATETAARRALAPMPKADPDEDTQASVRAFLEAPSCGCMWPIGDPRRPGFRFCGEVKAPKRSYCAEHVAVAYKPRRPSSTAAETVPASAPREKRFSQAGRFVR